MPKPKNKIKRLHARLENFKKNPSLNGDQGVIIVNEMRKRNATVKTAKYQPTLRSMVEGLIVTVNGIKSDVDSIHNDINDIRGDVKDIKARVTTLEKNSVTKEEFNKLIKLNNLKF